MKPAPFEYYAPTDVEGVLATLAELGEDAKVLAGGQSLVPMLNMRLTRFDALVDIGRVAEWKSLTASDDCVKVGAGVRQRDVEENETVAVASPLLALAAPQIGHFQIRSRGTVCGSIAHADPAAECPAVALTLDAMLDVCAALVEISHEGCGNRLRSGPLSDCEVRVLPRPSQTRPK